MPTSEPIHVEAAIDSVADAERAVREGATRLEVCGNLGAGGLTPSADLLEGCLALGVPCIAMVRPRDGNFLYDDTEFAQMCGDAKRLLAAGAHGIVFGSLRDDGSINSHHVAALISIAGNTDTVFHRAFDHTPSATAAFDTLLACGVRRILTSGHAPTATEGVVEIAALVRHSRGRIGILPGGTVRGSNVRELVSLTGVAEVHARASAPGVIAAICSALRAR